MAIIKCKMCGGDLVLVEGQSVAECEYCGSRQTVPTADNEKKMVLFERAERLRKNCEFDKAAGIYETIVTEFRTESEAYWGLVLCRYGIEYVDDPATGKKIPTCHRSSFDSILEDSDFEQVCENADTVARKVYREEAKQIEELRKGIIEVSGKEQPYDIFICYKETDENGERTLDSVLAQDVYDALTAKGYRVFFSRITLEDKLGQEYEPYIFAALNSAKIMLAFGTDYEYYNSVWVKNEWSRFLKLMEKDKTKHLIPCYKGIDAYDMPREFAKLQAQDLGKVGALQDLLRGVEKIIQKKGEPAAEEKTATLQTSPNTVSLLRRASLFLEDGEWEKADEYCEKVLDIDPENATAYLYKLMAQHEVHRREELKDCEEPIDDSDYFKKILRFGDPAIVEEVHGYISIIAERIAERAADAVESVRKSIKKAECLISTSIFHTVGLKTDGTVAAVGDNSDGQCDVSSWRDIVAVSAGSYHTVGLKADGTVVAVGNNDHGQCNVSDWRGIVAVSTEGHHTVGLKSDGTVVAVRDNDYGKCHVSDWKLFQNLETIEEEREQARLRREKEAEKARKREEQLRAEREKAKREKAEREKAEREKAEREKAERKAALEREKTALQTELANLRGLFTGKRRREIESRLAQIEKDLKGLN